MLLGEMAHARAEETQRLISENKEGLQERGVSQDTAAGLKGLPLPSLGQRAHEQHFKWHFIRNQENMSR